MSSKIILLWCTTADHESAGAAFEDAVLLVMANKQDLPNAMSTQESLRI